MICGNFSNLSKIKNLNNYIEQVFIPFSGYLAQDHSNFTCRCYYTFCGVNLWQIQLNGYDLERHQPLNKRLSRAKTKPWGQKNCLYRILSQHRTGEDYKKILLNLRFTEASRRSPFF